MDIISSSVVAYVILAVAVAMEGTKMLHIQLCRLFRCLITVETFDFLKCLKESCLLVCM